MVPGIPAVQDPYCVQLVNGTILVRLYSPGSQRGISQGGDDDADVMLVVVVVVGTFPMAAAVVVASASAAGAAAATRSLQ